VVGVSDDTEDTTAAKAGDAAAADTTATPEEPEDDLVTTEHSLQVLTGEGPATTELRYRARTGRLVVRREITGDKGFEGHTAVAEMAVTSYEVLGEDGEADTSRPVTFVFNGGPGASSVWLHLGVLGPRRVLMGDAGSLLPPPGGLADNRETLLRETDLVFVDPVSTGWSRVRSGRQAKEFHGFTGDVESVSELIRLWTTRNDRWLSPKLLAGESYGTLRAVAVAKHLQERHHLPVNGIALVSMVLDMGTIRFQPGNDRPYAAFLPTYARSGTSTASPAPTSRWRSTWPPPRSSPAGSTRPRWRPGPASTPTSVPASSPGSRSSPVWTRTSWTGWTCASSTCASTPSCCGTAAR
jgi:carboxypeptidase C (cathepsin A)